MESRKKVEEIKEGGFQNNESTEVEGVSDEEEYEQNIEDNMNEEEVSVNNLEEAREMLDDSETEQRDSDIYDIGELRFDWLDEEDVIYIVQGYTGDYERTSIGRVKTCLDRLLEDNEKPDLLKWLEVSHELEVFCEAAVEAGRDVIDFDVETREALHRISESLE